MLSYECRDEIHPDREPLAPAALAEPDRTTGITGAIR